MAGRGFAFLGFPNLIGKPYCTVSLVPGYAGIEPAGMEVSYLKTEEPSDKTRIATLDPLVTRWICALTKGSDREVGGLSAINANLSAWGMYRVSVGQPAYQDLAPTSIISSSNMSGAVTDVDEVAFSPDGLFMAPTATTSPWSVRLGGYATPTVPPTTGAYRAFAVVRVVLQGVPILLYPKLSVSLFQSGTVVSVLGTRAVTQTAGQLFIFAWDPTVLTDSTGANLRLNLAFDNGDNGCYAKLDLARLYVESTNLSQDSGFLASPWAGYSDKDIKPPTISLPYFPPSPWTNVSNITLMLIDDQVEHDPDVGSAAVGVPVNNIDTTTIDNYVEVGRFDAGEAIFLSIGLTQDQTPAAEVNIQGTSGSTLSGQSFGSDLWRRRETTPLELVVTRNEGLTLMQRIAWEKGNTGAFYIAFEPDSQLEYQIFTNYLATLEGRMSMRRKSFGESGLFIVSGVFVEKL